MIERTISMKNIIFWVIMFVLMIAGSCIAQQPAPAKVEGGLVQGTYEDGLTEEFL
jgi:para-nitrobenzyl esterase